MNPHHEKTFTQACQQSLTGRKDAALNTVGRAANTLDQQPTPMESRLSPLSVPKHGRLRQWVVLMRFMRLSLTERRTAWREIRVGMKKGEE
jgi:hypothetical protein